VQALHVGGLGLGDGDDHVGLAQQAALHAQLDLLAPLGHPLAQHVAVPQVAVVGDPRQAGLAAQRMADEHAREGREGRVDRVDAALGAQSGPP
jgi:hypothetical protein